jgi:hypothetical protein
MRRDLANYVPEIAGNRLLMCCTCGRFLPQEDFNLEHIIPRQALRTDPVSVRTNPATPANIRAGNLLLCKKPLLYKGSRVYNNGCNSWKGRFYDTPITELFSGRAFLDSATGKVTDTHIVGGLILGYLATVAKFGYAVTLMKSGLLMREQFFRPRKFHPSLGGRYQVLLGGSLSTSPDEKVWSEPFSFQVRDGVCVVAARNFAVNLPLSRDPTAPLARHLRFVPSKYKLRPDFRTVFS